MKLMFSVNILCDIVFYTFHVICMYLSGSSVVFPQICVPLILLYVVHVQMSTYTDHFVELKLNCM